MPSSGFLQAGYDDPQPLVLAVVVDSLDLRFPLRRFRLFHRQRPLDFEDDWANCLAQLQERLFAVVVVPAVVLDARTSRLAIRTSACSKAERKRNVRWTSRNRESSAISSPDKPCTRNPTSRDYAGRLHPYRLAPSHPERSWLAAAALEPSALLAVAPQVPLAVVAPSRFRNQHLAVERAALDRSQSASRRQLACIGRTIETSSYSSPRTFAVADASNRWRRPAFLRLEIVDRSSMANTESSKDYC